MLEIRSKTGGLLDALRRGCDAEVYALPAFESLQFVISELYGIPADGLIDFERFEIPYDGEFDLIIAKHMVTLSLYPERFFAVLRERLRLREGGSTSMPRTRTPSCSRVARTSSAR